MNAEQRAALQAEARAAWARKTPEERRASMQRLRAEILRDACDSIYRITCRAVTEQLVTRGATDVPPSGSER